MNDRFGEIVLATPERGHRLDRRVVANFAAPASGRFVRSAVIPALEMLRIAPTSAIHAAVRRVRIRENVGCGPDTEYGMSNPNGNFVRFSVIPLRFSLRLAQRSAFGAASRHIADTLKV